MFKSEYQIAKVWGIPIRLHLSFLIFLPILVWVYSPSSGTFAWLIGLALATGAFTSVVLHELGHALVALRQGIRVREILLLPIGGVAQLARIPEKPRQEIAMALAGPAVSVALGFICWLASAWIYSLINNRFWISAILGALSELNFYLAALNMIPSFPMDGGRVFRALLSAWIGRLRATRWAATIGKIMAVIFGLIGVYPASSPFLVAIAVFLFTTADAEYRMVKEEDARRHAQAPAAPQQPPGQGISVDADDVIIVSSSPLDRTASHTITVKPVRDQSEHEWKA